ncbi:GNAT family N-acetyltransferase [Mechercharimyces sp. CAU 1602]|uniref:GNAT family N-acetyltransferase n=1 Tax=Mechercharimyces sp. CAU 1602 TaxID=2973933 RepID=UPI002163D2D9|nr:GNAT family N-acetyltransferase [Mechercharimyces sp. CAU 1602]MCS1352292.1 GNAT family N-acetyltransferase [Mechercharimyces sp. CAU 1602]
MIQLSTYKSEHKRLLSTFSLPHDQLQYTQLPQDALHKCTEDPNRHPVVILHAERPVGFFILHHRSELTDFTKKETSLLIRSLSVNHSEQGKGIALQAMRLLPNYVRLHFPLVTELMLVVNEKNIAAQALYHKAGYLDHGIRREGPVGPQKILHYNML